MFSIAEGCGAGLCGSRRVTLPSSAAAFWIAAFAGSRAERLREVVLAFDL